MRTNISAFTAIGLAPGFVSINLDTDNDNEIEITVRSKAKPDGSTGDMAVITMDTTDFRKMAAELYSFACASGA